MENNMGNNIIKILAIDDIQDNLISIKALVYEAYPNALIYTALNGEKGLELAKTADPDVILLDIVMPEMDGFEVCKRLKQDRILSDIPVVFVTALKGDSENRIYALECGAEAFLAKPIDPSELKAQIRAMMKIKTANVNKRDEKERLASLVAEQTRELQVTHKITLDLLDDIQIENESRKKSEADLRESEERFRAVSEYSFNAICIVNESGKIIWANEAMIKMGGYSLEQIYAVESFASFIAPESLDFVLANFIKFVQGEDYIHHYEFYFIRANGEIRLGEKHMSHFKDRLGNMNLVISMMDITERKNAEDAIKRLEAIQHKMIANIGDVVAIIDKNGINTYKSPNLEKWFGWKPEEVVGNSTWDLVHPDDLESSQQFIGSLASVPNATGTKELRYLCKNGNYTWIEFTAVNLLNDPDINGILGNYHDISERKQAEKQLKESEQTFRNYIDYAPHGIFVVNEKGEYIDVNTAACNITGYSKDELLSMKIIELIPEESLEKAGNHFQKLIKDGNAYEELAFIKKNKTQGFWTVNAIKLNDHKFLGFVVDVTERKQAEKALKESEEKFRLLYTSMNQGLALHEIILDEKGNPIDYVFLDINETYTKLLGVTREMSIGKRIREVMPKVEQYWIDIFGKVALTGEPMYYENYLETTNRHYSTYSYSPKKYQFAVLVSDITDRKNSEIQLKEKNEELTIAKEKAEESDRLKTAFLQNMSHEIRTPMNAIMGFSHLLVGQYNNRPKLEEYTEIIKQRCNDLLDIINDILDIAKIESGQIKINEEECNIKDLFSELLTFFEPIQKRLEKEDITLNLLFDNDLSEVVFQSDKGKLKQIFINLINNAFKFTDEGSINVSCKINNNYLIFNVSDTGLGIPEDKKNKIFERFYQIETDYTRIYGGNGLGLSIVKGLVELLGGEIIVESQLKIGSTFSFTIPFKPVKSKKIQELSDETNSEYYFPNKTILIVEDDNSNAIYLKVILEDTGTILSFAKNGTQAIEMALAQDFDIILMDIGLPDISGYEATQFLIKNNPNLKIIAQTAFASADDQQNAYNAGCIDFLSKPMQVDSLLKTLNKYL
jgi:PAS domain S-box-containing protein